ncbi:MAG: calcium-binding protein [bacterium]|nr:calcium-binding protein [bacterium]
MIEGGVSGELNLNVTGNNLDNYLNGNAGDNVLTGGQGDDHFYDEEGGNDTYIYNLGDGNDYICDVNGNDTIQFGAGITSDNIMFLETSDGHLEIRFQGSEGSIVIEDYFNNEIDHKIENIKFSDGTTLTDISSLIVPYTEETDGYAEENTVINRLIQEMSSYAPEGEMANGEYNQNNDELLQLVAC